MADDFTGVPTELWYELRDDVRALKACWVLCAVLLVLLVWTLIQKGVLAGWGDLLHDVTPSG